MTAKDLGENQERSTQEPEPEGEGTTAFLEAPECQHGWCQYAEDVGMVGAHCGTKCQYLRQINS